MRRVNAIANHLLFASEAELVGLGGAAVLVMAVIALWAERRRARTARFDNVGWVPWTSIFVFCTMIGSAMMLLAIKSFAAG